MTEINKQEDREENRLVDMLDFEIEAEIPALKQQGDNL